MQVANSKLVGGPLTSLGGVTAIGELNMRGCGLGRHGGEDMGSAEEHAHDSWTPVCCAEK